MILIWNNGQQYSGRVIAFIDLCGAEPQTVEAALRFAEPQGSVTALAQNVEWRVPAACSVVEYLDRRTFYLELEAEERPTEFAALSPAAKDLLRRTSGL